MIQIKRRGGLHFTPVAPAEQRRAVRFLPERAFPTPTALLAPDVVRRMVPAGATAPLQGSNLELLRQLIDPGVFERMTEAAGATRHRDLSPSGTTAPLDYRHNRGTNRKRLARRRNPVRFFQCGRSNEPDSFRLDTRSSERCSCCAGGGCRHS